MVIDWTRERLTITAGHHEPPEFPPTAVRVAELAPEPDSEKPLCPRCQKGRLGHFDEPPKQAWCDHIGCNYPDAPYTPTPAPMASEAWLAHMLRLKSAERRQQALAAMDRETTQTLAGDAMLFENAAVRLEGAAT